MSQFDEFSSNEETLADPAADFLAKEEAELAKIENTDPFEAFESAVPTNFITDPFHDMDQMTEKIGQNFNINEIENNVN